MQKSSWHLLALECMESDNVATQMYCNFVFLKSNDVIFFLNPHFSPNLYPCPSSGRLETALGPGKWSHRE